MRFPNPLTLLVLCVLLAALATWILPAGSYERTVDSDGREIVVPGTYQTGAGEGRPVGLFAAMVALPRGVIESVEVVVLIFLVGGAFTVLDATGALSHGVAWLANKLESRQLLIVPVISMVFAAGGVIENLQEEVIALMPVMIILTRRLGFPPLSAALMSIGPAMVGSALSPTNPFQVGIAQEIAQLQLLSGGLFRTIFLVIALAFWITSTMRFVQKNRVEPEAVESHAVDKLPPTHLVIFAIVTLTFGILVYGMLGLGWGFNEMSGLFFLMGIIVGLIGRLGIDGTARAYGQGFSSMAYAAILVGFARSIYVVLNDGGVVDTVINALFTPISSLPPTLSALGMVVAHSLIHIPVSSVSGHAALTMPILVPLSDLLGVSRQVCVLAYQIGCGFSDLVIPTNGSLLAILAAGGLRYEEWLRWVLPRYLALMVMGGASVVIAMMIGLQ